MGGLDLENVRLGSGLRKRRRRGNEEKEANQSSEHAVHDPKLAWCRRGEWRTCATYGSAIGGPNRTRRRSAKAPANAMTRWLPSFGHSPRGDRAADAMARRRMLSYEGARPVPVRWRLLRAAGAFSRRARRLWRRLANSMGDASAARSRGVRHASNKGATRRSGNGIDSPHVRAPLFVDRISRADEECPLVDPDTRRVALQKADVRRLVPVLSVG